MTHGVINPYPYEGKGRHEGMHKGGGPKRTNYKEGREKEFYARA
jgi:hypothetical protein